MFDQLATKTDLAYTRELISKDMQSLEARMDRKLATLEHRLTTRMGAMLTGTVVIIGALQILL